MPDRSDEFVRIARYFAPLTEGFPGAFGLTDDAAVIAPMAERDIVVTTDTMIAGVHFIGDERPDLIAAKLLRVNLSDLAAMGATPLAYMLNVALPAWSRVGIQRISPPTGSMIIPAGKSLSPKTIGSASGSAATGL